MTVYNKTYIDGNESLDIRVEFRVKHNHAPYKSTELTPCFEYMELVITGALYERVSPRGTWRQVAYDCLHDELERFNYKLGKLAKRWHLNSIRKGTTKQQCFVHGYFDRYGKPYDYNAACKALAAYGLNPDKGYGYGNAWLVERLPLSAIAAVKAALED